MTRRLKPNTLYHQVAIFDAEEVRPRSAVYVEDLAAAPAPGPGEVAMTMHSARTDDQGRIVLPAGTARVEERPAEAVRLWPESRRRNPHFSWTAH